MLTLPTTESSTRIEPLSPLIAIVEESPGARRLLERQLESMQLRCMQHGSVDALLAEDRSAGVVEAGS